MLTLPKRMQHPLGVVAFALVLLLAQSLGLLHRAAGEAAQNHLHPSAGQPTGQHTGAHHHENFLGKLFAGHSSDADCQTFEQSSHFDSAAGLLATGLSLALGSGLCALQQGLAGARWHAQFQARGPPFPR